MSLDSLTAVDVVRDRRKPRPTCLADQIEPKHRMLAGELLVGRTAEQAILVARGRALCCQDNRWEIVAEVLKQWRDSGRVR